MAEAKKTPRYIRGTSWVALAILTFIFIMGALDKFVGAGQNTSHGWGRLTVGVLCGSLLLRQFTSRYGSGGEAGVLLFELRNGEISGTVDDVVARLRSPMHAKAAVTALNDQIGDLREAQARFYRSGSIAMEQHGVDRDMYDAIVAPGDRIQAQIDALARIQNAIDGTDGPAAWWVLNRKRPARRTLPVQSDGGDLASPQDRMIARTLDVIPYYSAAFVVGATTNTGDLLIVVGVSVAAFIVEAVMLKSLGATAGKLARRLVVVDATTGAELSWGQAFKRASNHLIPGISFGNLLIAIIGLISLQNLHNDDRRATVMDGVANTVVLNSSRLTFVSDGGEGA